MLRALLVCVFALVSFSCQSTHPDYKSIKGKTVLFLGDSITNNGLYVSYIEHQLFKKQLNVDVISIGLSSETASGLSEKDHPFPRPCIHTRLDKALKMIKPDIVVACYGMNDGIYHPLNRSRTLAYQIGIKQLIDKTEKAGSQVILMTPPPFDSKPIASKTKPKTFNNFSYKNPYEGYNEVLAEYTRWLNSLDYLVADQNTSLGKYLEQKRKVDSKFAFSKDGIHPDSVGHLLMAYTFLEAIGLSGDKKKLLENEKKISEDAIFKMVHERRKIRSKGWLKYVGYSRGETVKTDSVKDVELKCSEMKQEIQNTIIQMKMPR